MNGVVSDNVRWTMNNKTLLILTCAGAITGFGLTHLYLRRVESHAAGGEKVAVLAALDDIPVGTALHKDALVVRQVPAAYVSTRHVAATDSTRILGVRLSTGLKANDFLEWTDLSHGHPTGRDLSGLIQEGMRALSLRGSSLFDGLLRSGDRVDVLFSTNEGNRSTSTLLQNVLVLSVGGVMDQRETPKGGYHNPSSAVVSVTLEQSQLITQALQHGKIELALRNPNDIVIVEKSVPATADDVLKALPTSIKPAAEHGAAPINRPDEVGHVR
jgi:pilus assembly protein CpaB